MPFFIRSMVKRRVEEFASRQGSDLVLPRHLEECRQRFMESQDREVQGYRIEACFGSRKCSNRVLGDTSILEDLERFFGLQDFRGFLEQNVNGPLKMHHEFRVSVSFCPNACSRPQIADIGLIGAVRPSVASMECTGCQACLEECQEGAVRLDGEGPPGIDQGLCLGCGHCIRACPSGTLEAVSEGFRVMLGGKLGRHPVLAHELPGLFSEGQAMNVVAGVVDFYRANSRKGERLGALIGRKGLDVIYGFLNIPAAG